MEWVAAGFTLSRAGLHEQLFISFLFFLFLRFFVFTLFNPKLSARNRSRCHQLLFAPRAAASRPMVPTKTLGLQAIEVATRISVSHVHFPASPKWWFGFVV